MTTDAWAATGTWTAIAVSLVIAIAGGVRARGADRRAADANRRSKQADQRADEALELARSAEARADRLERIAVEHRDVAWEQRRVDPNHHGTLSFQHIGTTTAYDVTLIADPLGPGRRQEERLGTIEPTGRIGINLTTLAREATEEVHGTGLEPSLRVRAKVTWRSKEGVPDNQVWDYVSVL